MEPQDPERGQQETLQAVPLKTRYGCLIPGCDKDYKHNGVSSAFPTGAHVQLYG